MKRIILAIVLTLFAIQLKSQKWEWAYDGGSFYGHSVSYDPSGNIYVGSYGLTNSYGAFSLSCGTGGEIIAKHDPLGNVIWAEQIFGAGVSGISTDKFANAYVTGTCKVGTFCGLNTTFSLVPLGNNANYGDVFIAKYDPNGNIIWAKLWGFPNSDDVATTMKSDLNGNTYLAGRCTKTVSPGGTVQNYFLLKYDTQGTLLWSKTSNWQGDQYPTSLDLDEAGNCYVIGIFASPSPAIFDNIILTTNTYSSIFIAKYDKNGNVIWAKKDGTGYDSGSGISLDHKGNFYLTGGHGGTTSFGNITLTNRGMFVVKYDTSGTALWARHAGSSTPGGGTGGVGVGCDTQGNCFVTGNMRNLTTFSGGGYSITLTTPKTNIDIFVAKYDSLGNLKWAIVPGGGSGARNGSSGIAVDNNSNCFITGVFTGLTTFGNTTYTADFTNGSIFVAKIKDTIAQIVTDVKTELIKTNEFQVYPNPACGKFDILYSHESNEIIDLKVYDPFGKIIYTKSIKNFTGEFNETIDLIGFTKGVYTLELNNAPPTGSGTIFRETRKLIVE